jgi:hypothetical protein
MLAVILVALAASASAQAGTDFVKPGEDQVSRLAVPYTAISGAPLQIHIGDENSFQVFNDNVGGQGQIYPEWQLSTADMGIFVRIVGPGTLYAPNFSAHGITATWGLGAYTPWTPVSLSAVSGTGTAGDPYRVTVVSNAGSHLTMTMDVTYVNNDSYFFHDCTITNISESEVCFHFYVGSDIYLANSDYGYPYKIGNSVGGRDITQTYHILHIPLLPPSADHYCGKFYNNVWLDVANPPLNDDLSGYLDNGAALEWRQLCIEPGGSVTIRSATSFGEIPEIALNIPDQCIYSGGSFSPFDLDNYAGGIPPNSWTYTGNVSLSVSIDLNNVCTITYPSGWLGCEDIIFTVTDSYGTVDIDTASFCVRPIPKVLYIPDQTEPFSSFDLDNYIDPNSVIHLDSVTWSVTGMSCLQVTINPTTHVATVTDPGNACCLPETLTFTATVAGCYNDILTDSDNAVFTPLLPVALDIKPRSCPNPLNIKAYRDAVDGVDVYSFDRVGPVDTDDEDRAPVLPVAILGTPDFDVGLIDPSTVTLEGVPALRWAYEDVSTPMPDDTEECECNTDGADGYMDLTLKFDQRSIIGALGNVHDGDVIPLFIHGELIECKPIEGVDCVIIRAGRDDALLTNTDGELGFSLEGNYPNPFNPVTEISFSVPSASHVRLEVFNISGQKVTTLVDREVCAGYHQVTWDASAVASGVYFYRMQAGEFAAVKKMVLVK